MPLAILFESNAVKMIVELRPLQWGVTHVDVNRTTPEGTILKGICFVSKKRPSVY